MSDPAILFVRPKAISRADKKTLQAAGIIVIEVENLDDVKFVRPYSELGGSELLRAAAKAIADTGIYNSPREAFGRAVCAALSAPVRTEK